MKKLQAYQQVVVKDYKDLLAKTRKLEKFMWTKLGRSLVKQEQDLMMFQYLSMVQGLRVMEARLDMYGVSYVP